MIVWLRRGNTFIPYAKISGHGFRILAEAMEADLPYRLQCPALLICGEKDHAGSCIRYNKAWHKRTGIPIRWLKNAGHNSNTDEPQLANQLIADLVQKIEEQDHGCVSGSHQSCNFQVTAYFGGFGRRNRNSAIWHRKRQRAVEIGCLSIEATKASHFGDAAGMFALQLTAEGIAYLEEPYLPHRVVGAIDHNPAHSVMLLDKKKSILYV